MLESVRKFGILDENLKNLSIAPNSKFSSHRVREVGGEICWKKFKFKIKFDLDTSNILQFLKNFNTFFTYAASNTMNFSTVFFSFFSLWLLAYGIIIIIIIVIIIRYLLYLFENIVFEALIRDHI